MKQLHAPGLFGWSLFNPERNLDFHSVFWQRAAGNVVIDPLPLSEHDRRHVEALGGVREIVITNSDHVRAAFELSREAKARVWLPRQERNVIARLAPADVELAAAADGAELCAGLVAIELDGSKTPGELALLIEGRTLVAGDLLRGHVGGRLNLLPDAKLSDKNRAIASLERLCALPGIEAVLVGDGWPVFSGGQSALAALLAQARNTG